MWNRPYIPQLRSGSLDWQPFATFAPELDLGGEVRVLSRDSEDGASTCLWRIPPKWQHPGGFSLRGGEQLFILEGGLTKGEQHFGVGSYGYRPPGHAHEAMASFGGGVVLCMWDSALTNVSRQTHAPCPVGDGPLFINTAKMKPMPTPVSGPPTGIVVKILNREAATGGMTMLVTIPPGWSEDRAEHHDCTEESFKIAGDIWIVENGRDQVLSAGDYFIRPKRIKHGPMKTEHGTTSLIRFSSTVVNHYGPVEDASAST